MQRNNWIKLVLASSLAVGAWVGTVSAQEI